MRKRVIHGPAVRAIRELKAESDPSFKGSRFATTCMLSHAHLINIEKGRRPNAPLEVIERIAAHLGVSVDAISYEEKPALTEAAA